MNRKLTKFAITLLLLLFFSSNIYAQKNEQRVFLWDVSESLNQNKMWKPLQQSLIKAITSIPEDPSNRIVLVPFYDSVLETASQPATSEGKQAIINAIKKRGDKAVPHGSCKTNIVSAIRKFHESSSPEFLNYMFLFTDGKNEIGNLTKELNSWNSKNKDKQAYGFYVLVDPAADKQEVRDAEKTQDNFWVVKDANITIETISISPNTSINIRDNKSATIKVTGNTRDWKPELHFSVIKNPYYDVKFYPDIHNGKIKFDITQKGGQTPPETYDIITSVKIDNKQYPYSFVVPEKFVIRCINKPERTLKIEFKQ